VKRIMMSTCLPRWCGLEHSLRMVHNASSVVSELVRRELTIPTASPRSIDSESVARNNVRGKQSELLAES
jgi:hypothetical protein